MTFPGTAVLGIREPSVAVVKMASLMMISREYVVALFPSEPVLELIPTTEMVVNSCSKPEIVSPPRLNPPRSMVDKTAVTVELEATVAVGELVCCG